MQREALVSLLTDALKADGRPEPQVDCRCCLGTLRWIVLGARVLTDVGLHPGMWVAPERFSCVHTVLVPPLLCSSRVYASVLDTVWSHGSVTVADTLHDDTIAGLAARLLRDAPDRFALLGTSMGGYVALEAVRQAPERVVGLALVSTSAPAASDEQLAARARQSLLVEQGHFDQLVDAAFRGVVAERHESDAELLDAWRGMAATVGPAHFLRQQAATMTRSDSRGVLAGIACPTFVVHGAEDRLIPVAAGEEIAAAVPGATLRLIEEAGHFLFLEQSDKAAAGVEEFRCAVQPSARAG